MNVLQVRKKVAFALSVVAFFAVILFWILGNDEGVSELEVLNEEVKATVQPNAELSPWIWKSKQSNKKKVLVLGYSGGGAENVADIFKQNPEYMYYSEPTDAAYSSLYGTLDQWSALDIKYNIESKERQIPELEEAYIVENLRRYYECNVDLLPESLGKLLQSSKKSNAYRISSKFNQCLFTQTQQRDCESKTSRASYKMRCYPYFNPSQIEAHNCLGKIQTLEEKAWKIMFADGRDGRESVYEDLERQFIAEAAGVVDRAFVTYFLCQYQYKLEHMRSCAHNLEDECKAAKGAAVLDTRMPAQMLDILLPAIPDMRVVYVLDSPMDILKQRQQLMLLSRASKSSVAQEATLLCATMVDDLKRMAELGDKYPGRITFVHLRDYVNHADVEVERIYKFVNETIPDEVLMTLHSVGYERRRFADLTGSMLINLMTLCAKAEEEVAAMRSFGPVVKRDNLTIN